MNKRLTYEIAYHISSKFGITQHESIKLDDSHSLLNKRFLTDKSLTFEENDQDFVYKINSCVFEFQQTKINVLCSLVDCKLYLVFNISDCPSYGIVLFLPDENSDNPQEAFICQKMKNVNWNLSSIFFQASFLAGLENTLDVPIGWNPNPILSNEDFDMMKSFISYSNDLESYYE